MSIQEIAGAIVGLNYSNHIGLAAGIIGAAGEVPLMHPLQLAGAIAAWASGKTLTLDDFPPLAEPPATPAPVDATSTRRQVNLNSHKIRALTGLSSE